MFEGNGSRQQDLHGEERMIRLTWSFETNLKHCSLSPVKERAFETESLLRESRRDRILAILEIKNSLKISGILSRKNTSWEISSKKFSITIIKSNNFETTCKSFVNKS